MRYLESTAVRRRLTEIVVSFFALAALQVEARALLAKQRGVAAEEVAWERGTIHHLRATFGTHMAQHVSMNDLRRLMGHASITTTADFYVGVSEDLAARVAAAFRRTA